MNICHVITRLIIGGAQENTVLTCRGLVERRHQVTLIAGPETGPEGSLWDQAEKSGCKLVRLDTLRRAVNPIVDWRARSELVRVFSEFRPDVVHTHSSKAGILGRSAAAKAHSPIVVHTIHGMSFNRTQSPLTRLSYRFLERRAANWTTMFISVADAMTNQAVQAGIAPRKRFVTIRSGVETDRFQPSSELRTKFRRAWGIRDDEVVVGTVARLFRNKGYEELLDAIPVMLSRAPNLRFVWIGDGANRDEYLTRLDKLGVRERVRLVGLVPPTELPAYLNGFDIVVHASRWEGLARVLVQAMLTELPVVCFDNDGAPEVVRPGETGILAPLGDVQRLVEGVVKLAEDSSMRERFGRQGRARCMVEFDWRKMATDIEALYVRLSERRASAPDSGIRAD